MNENLRIYLIKSKNQLMDYYNDLRKELRNKNYEQYEKDGYTISLEKAYVQLNHHESENPIEIEIGYVLHIVNDSWKNESMSVEDFVYIDGDTGCIKNVVSIFNNGVKITKKYRYPYSIDSEYEGYEYDPTNKDDSDKISTHSIRTINEHLCE